LKSRLETVGFQLLIKNLELSVQQKNIYCSKSKPSVERFHYLAIEGSEKN